MATIKYKINGYWHELKVDGQIEAISYDNEVPAVLEINVADSIEAESGLV